MNVQFWIGGADSLLKLCSMVLDFGKAAGYAKPASMLEGLVMQGFESRWKDFPDYILGITKEIWEDRCIGPKVRQYYGEDVVVRMPGGISTGPEATVSATAATLNEFPDRVLLGEDVIWSGTPKEGMLSSHRIFSTATHLADGAFGTATGRAVATRAIADCYAKDGVITDEWLVRDNGGLVRQIGQDPRAWAAKKVDAGHRAFDPSQNIVGPYTSKGNDSEWAQALVDILNRMMSADFSAVASQYDRACHLEYAGGVTGHGHTAADAFWLTLRASFPSAEFQIEHQIGLVDPLMPPRAAVRWSLTGQHDGWGAFGMPTSAPIYLMGMTHAEFGPYGLRREYTLYDETAVWMQILTHTG